MQAMKRIITGFLAALVAFSSIVSADVYYTHAGFPAQGITITSAPFRAEFDAIQAGFDLLPQFAGNNSKLWRINSSATAVEAFTPTYTDYSITNTFALIQNFSSGVAVTGTVSATSFTGAGTGLTGTAAGLAIGGNASTVTTNAN